MMGLAEWRLVAETPEPVLNLCLAHAVTRQLMMALCCGGSMYAQKRKVGG